MPPRLRGKQGEAQWTRQPLLTTKRAHFGLRWWERGCALDRGECLVGLESLADMLGARVANFVDLKTVKVKEGATTNCQPLLTTKQAHFGWGGGRAGAHSREVSVLLLLRPSPMCLVPSGPMLFLQRLRGPNKEQSQPSAPADKKASAFWLETVKVKQGAATNCQPLLTTTRAHFGLRWWERGRALEGDECLVDLESLSDVLGARVANFVILKTVKVKQGAATNCQPLLTTTRAQCRDLLEALQD
eukprot:scaffold3362_cov121-Isochrysis_galbana.AAC.4